MPCVLLSKYFSHSHSNPILILRFHHVDHLPGSGEIHHCVPSLLQVQTHVSSKSTKCMRQPICKSSLYHLLKSTQLQLRIDKYVCRWSAKHYVVPVLLISVCYNFSRFYELEVWSYPITGKANLLSHTFTIFFVVLDIDDLVTNETLPSSNTTYFGKFT